MLIFSLQLAEWLMGSQFLLVTLLVSYAFLVRLPFGNTLLLGLLPAEWLTASLFFCQFLLGHPFRGNMVHFNHLSDATIFFCLFLRNQIALRLCLPGLNLLASLHLICRQTLALVILIHQNKEIILHRGA